MTNHEQSVLPSEILTSDGTVPIIELDSMYRETPYGKILMDRSRWGANKSPLMSDELFQSVIGVDANNMKHLRLSYGLGKVFLSRCSAPAEVWGDRPVSALAQFTGHEELLFLVNTLTHDWGEPIVGDIAMPLKSKMSEYEEFQHMLRIAYSLTNHKGRPFGRIFPVAESALKDTTQPVYRSVLRGLYTLSRGQKELFGIVFEAADEMLLQADTKLAKAFNAFEYGGYLRSGIRGWKVSPRFEQSAGYPDARDRFRGMAYSVLTHNLRDIIRYSATYPPIYEQLIANAPVISEIYAQPALAVAETLHTYQNKWAITVYTDKWATQKQAWEEFTAANQQVIDKYHAA